MSKKLKLGVNVDHVATLRQARGTAYPDVTKAALICLKAGAYCITTHLREDRRHIQDKDVWNIRTKTRARLNLEMACTPEIVNIALKIKPDEACIVPEKREELTTEGGLNVAGADPFLAKSIRRMTKTGIMVSLFIDPSKSQIEASAKLGVPCVELHTGRFCDTLADKKRSAAEKELKRLIKGATLAHDLGLTVNAGHGINMDNIDEILHMPFLNCLNIGHSIIARSVFIGLNEAIKEMMQRMNRYHGGTKL